MSANTFFRNAVVLLAAGAAYDQLRRPATDRTWYGRVAGVPYDFRQPTMDSTLDKIWDPGNPSLLAPTIWGVGWTFNLYRLAHPFSS